MVEASNGHLTLLQRCKIEAYLSSGYSQRVISRQLGVAFSTVSREVQRNGNVDGRYDATRAHQRAVATRRVITKLA